MARSTVAGSCRGVAERLQLLFGSTSGIAGRSCRVAGVAGGGGHADETGLRSNGGQAFPPESSGFDFNGAPGPKIPGFPGPLRPAVGKGNRDRGESIRRRVAPLGGVVVVPRTSKPYRRRLARSQAGSQKPRFRAGSEPAFTLNGRCHYGQRDGGSGRDELRNDESPCGGSERGRIYKGRGRSGAIYTPKAGSRKLALNGGEAA